MSEKKDGRVVITREDHAVYYGYFCDGKPVELYAASEEERNLVGNIYIARIDRIMSGTGGAFVAIDRGNNVYLPYLEKGRPLDLQGGDRILVQIVRDGSRSKLPKASRYFHLSGMYFAILDGETGIHLSRKIMDLEERERLKAFTEKLGADRFGVIVRTNAAYVPEETLREEYEALVSKYEEILLRAENGQFGTLLYEEPPQHIRFAKELPKREIEEIVTDQKDIYESLCRFCGPDYAIRYYQDEYDLKKVYRLPFHYEQALRKKIWLPSGAFLVVEETEAMTVIDVNSGGVTGERKNLDEVLCQVNLEAAREIARLLRLRNLSGIIVIDFINMKSEKRKRALLKKLEEFCAMDRRTVNVIDFTRLGLVEMTRKKVLGPISQQLAECHGSIFQGNSY